MPALVYLIPTVLDENGFDALPSYLLNAIGDCEVFFVEDERTARRFLKKIWKEMVIDHYTWYAIGKAETDVIASFAQEIKNGKKIGIISEAGCPGVADPGQKLVARAQEMEVVVKPLVGPSSLLLALMASGMNGQQFSFHGYLPIEATARNKRIRDLEADSVRTGCTHIFIETPYRNRALLEAFISQCKPNTRLCIAVNITAPVENIRTKTIQQWKQEIPELHKQPAVFLLQA
jgi:16S rRNA (cytidine1402-2'-O)-methyltransferase